MMPSINPAPLEGLKAAVFVKSSIKTSMPMVKPSNVMGPSGAFCGEGNSRRGSSLGSAA